MVALHQLDQGWRERRIIRPVAIGHDIDVGLHISEDAAHHMAFTLTGLGPDNGACPARNVCGRITGIVVEDINGRVWQGFSETVDDGRNGRCLIVAGQDDSDARLSLLAALTRIKCPDRYATHRVSLSVTTIWP